MSDNIVERLRFAAKDPAGTDTHVAIYRDLCAEAAGEIERLSAARTKANNEWRLDYNKCAAERDVALHEIERLQNIERILREELDASRAEIERLRAALREVWNALDTTQHDRAMGIIRTALSGKGES